MKTIKRLILSKRTRKYNECAIRHLEANQIQYKLADVRGGYLLQVMESDFQAASRIVGKISYTNPHYPKKSQ